jgi:adenine-specific DNA-methyltransferase
VRLLHPRGSICWQVGNHVDDGEVVPLDIVLYPIFKEHGLKLRNRIVWHFEHGLHCTKRLSGRYETILWFTKSNDYTFNLDPIRVPSKYPGKKHFKGPRAGQLSGNPLGKNPSDVWIFPNVKNNHVEKTVSIVANRWRRFRI